MQITWFGHAAFGVQGVNADGERVRIVLDPYHYPDCGGYLPVDVEAEIVSVSHDNVKYHSDTSSIRGAFELLAGLEYAGQSRRSHGVQFSALEVYEDDAGTGPNAMVKFTLEGITIAHQGDLGHALSDTGLAFLQGTDLLLALAGGPPTIALADLKVLIDTLRPALVIPMHFKTPRVNLGILPVDDFLATLPGYPVHRLGDHTLPLDRESLPQQTTICVLDHAR